MLTTVLITVAVTLAVVGLSACVWVIFDVRQRLSVVEGLCNDFTHEFVDTRQNFDEQINDCYRTIENNYAEVERQLDKRFDAVYRKVGNNKNAPSKELLEG